MTPKKVQILDAVAFDAGKGSKLMLLVAEMQHATRSVLKPLSRLPVKDTSAVALSRPP